MFTGGGSEANTLAIRGMLATRPTKRHFVTTTVEHNSVLRLSEQLAAEGYQVTRLGVDSFGRLDLAEVERSLTDDTALISVMHANNETGVFFPIEQVGELAAARGIPFHVDATQTVGKVPIDVRKLPVSLLTMAPHKFHGPKGVGVVFIGRRVKIRPVVLGGHQEIDLRAGTENVPGIVGTGVALQLAIQHLEEENTRVRAMRDRLEAGILERVVDAYVNGDREHRLPNTTNISFEGLEAEAILMLLSNEGSAPRAGRPAAAARSNPRTSFKRWGSIRSLATARSASRSRGSTPTRRSAAHSKSSPAVIDRLRQLSPRTVLLVDRFMNRAQPCRVGLI